MPPRYLYSIGHQKNMAILNAWLQRLVEMEKKSRPTDQVEKGVSTFGIHLENCNL